MVLMYINIVLPYRMPSPTYEIHVLYRYYDIVNRPYEKLKSNNTVCFVLNHTHLNLYSNDGRNDCYSYISMSYMFCLVFGLAFWKPWLNRSSLALVSPKQWLNGTAVLNGQRVTAIVARKRSILAQIPKIADSRFSFCNSSSEIMCKMLLNTT